MLSLIVAGLLLFTGWKGGDLVYRHRVAVLSARNRRRTIQPQPQAHAIVIVAPREDANANGRLDRPRPR